MNKKVGVIGGMGPMATAKFMELVINNTKASCDQDNVDMLVCQYSSIPDRTGYILNEQENSPVPKMIEAAMLLERENCDFLVMPCNTATFFYDKVQSAVNIPLINIAEETVKCCLDKGAKKIGLMATDGTIKAKVYEYYTKDKCELFIPNDIIQKNIMGIIYNEVKQNKIPDKDNFLEVVKYFRDNNCDVIVMGCTELSVAIEELDINEDYIVDSLTVLAKLTITKAGKILK